MSYDVAFDETSNLISAEKVEGTMVYDSHGEKLGQIETVMIDKLSGKVVYAVMSIGGFLGIGEEYHPLPWNVLKYDTKLRGYSVDVNEQTLKNAPTVKRGEKVDWADELWGRRVHEHYGATPYWT